MGQRQIISAPTRVTFGRHPSNDVAFDAQEDIDASSRHAEVVVEEGIYTLRDVGSSNGTWLGSESIQEYVLVPEHAIEVQFGSDGPVVRLWLGESPRFAPPPPPRPTKGWRRLLPWL